MSRPDLIDSISLNIFEKYLPSLEQIMFKMHKFDLDKFIKINNYYNRYKVLTKNQYRAFKHYCKVYGVPIPNSLYYMLED